MNECSPRQPILPLERAAADGGDARGRGLGPEPDRPARRGGPDLEGAHSTGKFDYHKGSYIHDVSNIFGVLETSPLFSFRATYQ